MRPPRRVVASIVLLWATVVTGFYFKNHSDVLTPIHPELSVSELVRYFVFIVTLIVVLAAGVNWLAGNYKKIAKRRLGVLSLIGLFFGLTLLLGWTRFMWSDFGVYYGPTLIQTEGELQLYQGEAISPEQIVLDYGMIVQNPQDKFGAYWADLESSFEAVGRLEGFMNMVVYLFIYLGLASLIVAICGIWGVYGMHLLKRRLKESSDLLVSIGIGTILMSFVLLGIALAGIFNLTWVGGMVLVVTGVFLAIERKPIFEAWNLLKALKTPPMNKINILVMGGWITIALLTAWNLIQASAPLPSGFDDFELYMNLPNLIAQSSKYVAGNTLHAFALLQGLGVLLTGNTGVAQVLTALYGVLAFGAVYALVRPHTDSRGALLATLITASLPIVFYHSHLDIKVEMPVFAFGALALLALQHWLTHNKTYWLILAGLFTGFAMSIKLTAALLVITVVGIVLIQLFIGAQKKFELKRAVTTLAILFVSLIVPAAPSLALNGVANQSLAPHDLLYDSQPSGPTIDWEALGIDQSSCESLGGGTSDYDRYNMPIVNDILRMLRSPWDATVNISALSPAVDIGFLFLGLCPILLFGVLKKRKRDTPKTRPLMVGGFIFWVLWMFIGKGPLWYGMAGIPFLLLWLAVSLEWLTNSSKKPIQIWTFILIGIWITTSIFMRTNYFISRTSLITPYQAGIGTAEDFLQTKFPYYAPLISALNADLSETIYFTNNAFLKFFVQNNNTRTYEDRYLDTFSCLYQENDDALLLERLQQSGFDYVVLSVPVYDENFPQLYDASLAFLQFVETNLSYIGGNAQTHVFQITSRAS